MKQHDYMRELAKGFVKFAVVGGIGYFENLGIFYVETRVFHIFDILALAISFVIVVFSNLIGNVVNRNIRVVRLRAFPLIALKFYLTSVLGYFEDIVIYYVETRYLHVFDILALMIATGLVALSNYGGNILLGNIKIRGKPSNRGDQTAEIHQQASVLHDS